MFFCQNSFLKLAFLNRDSTVLHMFLKAAILKNQEKHPPTNNCSHCALCSTYVVCIKWCVQGIMFSDRIRDERHTSQWVWSIYEGVLKTSSFSGSPSKTSDIRWICVFVHGIKPLCTIDSYSDNFIQRFMDCWIGWRPANPIFHSVEQPVKTSLYEAKIPQDSSKTIIACRNLTLMHSSSLK